MKLVTHANAVGGLSRWTTATLQAGAVGAKILDRPDTAYNLAVEFPRAAIVYRRVEPGDLKNLSDWRRQWPDPKVCADTVARYALIEPRPNLIVEGINEPKLDSLDTARWYGQVEAERAKILAGRKLRAAIGGFATGNPTMPLFVEFMRAYRAAGGPDADIQHHQYSHHLLEPGFGPGQDHENLLRHRLLREAAASLVRNMRWIIGETGLDTVDVAGLEQGKAYANTGWSQLQYWQRMLAFDRFLEEDADVLLAAIYAYRQPGWSKHEMEDLNEFNTNLVAAISADGQQKVKPDCNRTDVPDNWTHMVEAAVGLNVRSEPKVSTPSAANVLCAMVTGKQVRALKRTGDWMQIDWPVPGYCWAPNLKERQAVKPPEHKLGTPITLPAGSRFVDVSAWQDPADVDWKALRWNGCSAAMIRLAAGTLTDPEWHLYAAGAKAAQIPWFGYVYYSFVASWQSQIAALTAAINKMAQLPTVAIDLEGANPTKADADLRNYVKALELMGVPVALYTRQSWVAENLPQLSTILGGVPLIVANYRYPVDAQPALPLGYAKANAWQHVAGEKVETDKLYWARFMTRSGKYLDESIVTDAGLRVWCEGSTS